MLPPALAVRLEQVEQRIKDVLQFLELRLTADLSDLQVVSIKGRTKSADSVFQKLQTGKYSDVREIRDLVGLTVVLLYRRQVPTAIDIVRHSGLTIVEEPTRTIEATDFRYREPKLYVAPPADYLDRHPELAGLLGEVQFTSALQHALDMTTHDFDYKGKTYSWVNFRLVAQLRGMLEMVDSMIDDIGKVSIPNNEVVEAPADFVFASAMLDVLAARFAEERLPPDRRRMADTVALWARCVELSPPEVGSLLDAHRDLVQAESLDPTSAVLGCLLRRDARSLLSSFDGRLCVSAELDSLCSEARQVPPERRVSLDVSFV